VRALAESIIRITGSRSRLIRKPLPADDPQQRRPDIELARRTLDWSPTVSIETGLQSTIGYFDRLLSRNRASTAPLQP
jgi:UDP-glucuronate decarboxylase